MNHLADSQLNEYLDNVLDKSEKQQCDLHLSSCAECRARLEEMQHLFIALDDLPEKNLQRDLSFSIINRSPQKQSRLWTPIFAAQLGAAIGVLIWLSVQATKLVMPFLTEFQFPTFRLPPSTPRFALPTFHLSLLNLYSLFSNPYLLSSIPHFPFPIFNLSTFQLFNLSTLNIIVIVISVFTLWLVGNLSLLRSRSGVQE